MSPNTKMNLISLYNIQKVKNSHHIRFVPHFYNHNTNLCNKFTSIWVFRKSLYFPLLTLCWNVSKLCHRQTKCLLNWTLLYDMCPMSVVVSVFVL